MNSTKNSRASKKVFFANHVFRVDENVYEPAEDTFLLAENLHLEKGELVLEIGTGCGIVAIIAAEKAAKVVATDINPYALKCAVANAKQNKVANKIEFRLGNLFEPIRPNEKFDLIIFNAPYLPSEKPLENQSLIEKAWSGGRNGRELINPFISQVSKFLKQKGRVLLVQSNISSITKTLQKFAENGFKAEIVAKRDVGFFESIVLVKAKLRP